MKTLYSSPSAEMLTIAKEDILVSSLLEKLDNIADDNFALLGGDGN